MKRLLLISLAVIVLGASGITYANNAGNTTIQSFNKAKESCFNINRKIKNKEIQMKTKILILLICLLFISTLLELTLSHGMINRVVEMGNKLINNLQSDFTKVLVLIITLLFIIAITFITIKHLPAQDVTNALKDVLPFHPAPTPLPDGLPCTA